MRHIFEGRKNLMVEKETSVKVRCHVGTVQNMESANLQPGQVTR